MSYDDVRKKYGLADAGEKNTEKTKESSSEKENGYAAVRRKYGLPEVSAPSVTQKAPSSGNKLSLAYDLLHPEKRMQPDGNVPTSSIALSGLVQSAEKAYTEQMQAQKRRMEQVAKTNQQIKDTIRNMPMVKRVRERDKKAIQDIKKQATPSKFIGMNVVGTIGGNLEAENWDDKVGAVKRLIRDGKDADYAVTDALLKQLKTRQSGQDFITQDDAILQNYYDAVLFTKQADILAKTKMDGKDYSVLEELQRVSRMDGKKKKERKAAVLKKMEELGIDPKNYAIFSGDSNFTLGNFGNMLGWSALSGLSGAWEGLASAADFFVGKPLQNLGWENNPISEAHEFWEGEHAYEQAKASLYTERLGGGKGWQFASDAVQVTSGAIPDALMAFATMGGSTGTSLASKAAYETAGSGLAKAGLKVEQMMRNPNYWTSFARTVGNDYEEAKERGASDTVATLGAILTSLVNAGIETGVDGGSGIQGLSDDLVKDKNKLWAFVESIAEESGEEYLQKFVSEIVTKVAYDQNAEILKPEEYARDAALGGFAAFGLGGLKTGSKIIADSYNQFQASKEQMLREAIDEVLGLDASASADVGAVEPTQKNAAPEETTVTVKSGTSAINERNRENKTLAYTLATNIQSVSDMSPVAVLTGKELNNRNMSIPEQIASFFKGIGNKVFRKGFGDVSLGEYGVGGMMNHRPINRAKMVSLAAVPNVIQNGRQIGYDPNWKGRGYASYIFAAPVTVNGTDVYVAAVVDKRPDNKFYLSEMVDSEGNYVRIEESPSGNSKNGVTDGAGNSGKAGVTARPEGLPEGGNPSTTSAEPTPLFNHSIPENTPGVNTNSAQIVDTETQAEYDNTTKQGGNNHAEGLQQNDRAGGFGDPAQGMAGVRQNNGPNAEGQREHGGVAVNSGILRISQDLTAAQQRRGTPTYSVYDTTSNPEAYEQALIAGRNSDAKNGWCVTPKTAQELRDGNVRTFMNDTGTVGVGIAPDGDIVAVFKNKNGGPQKALDTAMPIAIEQGGDRLDCYGEGLVGVYSRYGFIPVARVEFNPEYANEGWTQEKGTPYIYVMMHNGDRASQVVENMGNYPVYTKAQLDALPTYGKDDYDAAMAYRDSLISEKGNTSSHPVAPTDSMGAAPSGFDPNSHLQYQYGTLPEGKNAVRPDDLPVSTDGVNRVSQTAVTVKGAKVTPDEFADLMTKDVTERNGMTYIPITNNATVQKAIDFISEEGWEDALDEWRADVRSGKAGADMSAMGALLLNNAAKAGDKAAWLKILHDYQLLGTNTAQGLQALRILKQLSPSDKLYMAKRSVKQMVRDMKLDADIAIDPELEAEYNAAETDEQRDVVLKKIQKDIARQLPTTFMEKFTALRYLNMLGNLRTQARNVVGNLTMMGTRAIHNAVDTGIERIANWASHGKIGRTRSVIVNKEQMAAGMKDFDSLQDHILDGGKFSDNMTATGFARGVQEQKRIFAFKPLEGYRKVTNWMMEQGDIIFARQAYARALAGYLKANGVTEADFSKVDPAIMDDARLFAAKEAQEATFRDSNWVSNWVSKIGRRKDTPAGMKILSEGVMPFRKTPANVLVRAEEYSPLGIVNSVVLSVQAAKNGSDVTANQVINSWAKTLTGTGLFGMGMLLQCLGLLSAGLDEDEQKDGFEDLNGWQNYALTLPDGTNLTIDCLSPSAIPVLMGAQMMQQIGEGGFQLKDLEKALTSIADPLVEMSMLQGVNDSLENIQYTDNNLGQFLINAATSYLTQGLTNTFVGQLERSFEDSRQQTYVDKDSQLPAWLQRTLGKASAKIPGLDYNQIPYINAWGEEEENPPAGLNLIYNLLSPSYISKGIDNALTRELNRLNDVQSNVNVYPATPDKTVTINKQDYHLSADEYVQLAKLQGQTQKQIVEDLIASSDYANLSDEDKAKAIREAYDYARDYARGEVIKDHPGLTTKWMQEIGDNIADGIIRHITADGKYTSLSVSDASYIDDLLDGLVAEKGKTNVRDIQRIEVIADSKLSEKDQKAVLKDTLDASAYEKYLRILALGLDTDDYAATYRAYLDAEGDGKKKRTIAQYQKDLGVSYSVAKKLYEIYCPPAK